MRRPKRKRPAGVPEGPWAPVRSPPSWTTHGTGGIRQWRRPRVDRRAPLCTAHPAPARKARSGRPTKSGCGRYSGIGGVAAEHIDGAGAAAHIDPLAPGIEEHIVRIRTGQRAPGHGAGPAIQEHEPRRRAENCGDCRAEVADGHRKICARPGKVHFATWRPVARSTTAICPASGTLT